MSEDEFEQFVRENKEAVDKCMENIKRHSESFDKKVKEILSAL